MNHEDYTVLVLKTESVLDSDHKVDKGMLVAALNIHAAASSLLDQVKRKMYYGEKASLNRNKIDTAIDSLEYNLQPFRDAAFQGDEAWQPGNEFASWFYSLMHGVIGIGTESGELSERLSLMLQRPKDEPVRTEDMKHFFEELGDLSWYEALVIKYGEFSIEEVRKGNIAKLAKRHGDKFNAEGVLNRDLAAEKEVLNAHENRGLSITMPAIEHAAMLVELEELRAWREEQKYADIRGEDN